MLLGFRLKNIALIDTLDLSFDKGFTVLTGETGAGKSVLLDALETLFAGPHSISATRIIRAGQDHGVIEATFLVDHQVRKKELNLVRNIYKSSGIENNVKEFFSDMPRRIFESDLIISRSGSSTVNEIIYYLSDLNKFPFCKCN